jgi:hypothetical protein
MGNRLLLLAQTRAADSIFNNMGSSLRGRDGLEWLTLVKLAAALGGAVLAVALVVYGAVRLRRLWRNTPTWLFLRLCQAHHLGWIDRWLLWRAVRHLSLAEPAQVFVEPVCLEDATTLPALFQATPRLLELRALLFAGAEDLPGDLTIAAPSVPPPAAEPEPSPSAAYRPPDGSVAALDDLPLSELLAPPLDWPTTPQAGGIGSRE